MKRKRRPPFTTLATRFIVTTLAQASSQDKDIANESASKVDLSTKVGQTIAKKANDKGIKEIVFDRGGYLYHGRVKALADAARESGLEF